MRAKDNLFGPTAENILEVGKVVNSMDKVCIPQVKVNRNWDFGIMGKELNGLITTLKMAIYNQQIK